jgi:hypothetical protein
MFNVNTKVAMRSLRVQVVSARYAIRNGARTVSGLAAPAPHRTARDGALFTLRPRREYRRLLWKSFH